MSKSTTIAETRARSEEGVHSNGASDADGAAAQPARSNNQKLIEAAFMSPV